MRTTKLFSFILIIVMLFSFAGCQKTEQPSGTDNSVDYSQLISAPTPIPHPMSPISEDPKKEGVKVDGIIPEEIGSFSDVSNLKNEGFSIQSGGKISVSPDKGTDNSPCLAFQCGKDAWMSWTFNLNPFIKEAGDYTVSFDVLLEGDDLSEIENDGFIVLIRGNAEDVNSFIQKEKASGNHTYVPEAKIDGFPGEWTTVSFNLPVIESDIDGTLHRWALCFNGINSAVSNIYIDNIEVSGIVYGANVQTLVTEAQTYVKEEMTFIASTDIKDPLMDATFDVIFKNGETEMIVPGFWDGDNVWKVRFALPTEGTWTYTTVFSDTTDSGLHNISGNINVTKYSGDLNIYKHGFVKTDFDKKYFVYADGTPFFYLGDTHWNFLREEYDSAGETAGKISTTSHFKYIVNKRVSQGFTVYQSEPLDAPFDLSDGLSIADIQGLKTADKYFEYIANMGLVHANSQFFFSSVMINQVMKMENYEAYLDALSRYWVARFGAYPVMWTLAQEVDDDYFYMDKDSANTTMNAQNNPWKLVCQSLYKYDPHKNPISAHQESCSKIMDQTSASDSAFRDVEGHSWWAAQWKPYLDKALDFSAARDFWENGQNKPAIVYEARYESLWTNDYGARIQGWIAFLNGFYGHGYGAVDIWLYANNYDLENDTVRDSITITIEEKSTPWSEAIEFPVGYQMGYMKEFFEKYEWWNLVPLFDNSAFVSETGTYSIASIEDNTYILYFYDAINGESTKNTGTLKNLDGNYTYQWFNPRNGQYSNKMSVILNNGEFEIGERPSAEDWVLVIEKVK